MSNTTFYGDHTSHTERTFRDIPGGETFLSYAMNPVARASLHQGVTSSDRTQMVIALKLKTSVETTASTIEGVREQIAQEQRNFASFTAQSEQTLADFTAQSRQALANERARSEKTILSLRDTVRAWDTVKECADTCEAIMNAVTPASKSSCSLLVCLFLF